MFYTIYQITNIANDKIYIGAHKTSDTNDGYMSSSAIVAKAIKKYGLENFIKNIIHVVDTEKNMFAKEAKLVNEDFIKRSDTYNVTLGGRGGFYHINNDPVKRAEVSKLSSKANKGVCRKITTQEEKDATSKRNKKALENNTGLFSPESIAKMLAANKSSKKIEILQETMKGETNGMLGSAVYINLITKERKRFLRNDIISKDWIKFEDYKQDQMKKNWYNDGVKNYLIDKNDVIIIEKNLLRGRIKSAP